MYNMTIYGAYIKCYTSCKFSVELVSVFIPESNTGKFSALCVVVYLITMFIPDEQMAHISMTTSKQHPSLQHDF